MSVEWRAEIDSVNKVWKRAEDQVARSLDDVRIWRSAAVEWERQTLIWKRRALLSVPVAAIAVLATVIMAAMRW